MYLTCCTRDQTVRFAYVTSLWVERKQTRILCTPQTLPTQELRQRDTKYCRWGMMFMAWTVYVSLSATPPKPSDAQIGPDYSISTYIYTCILMYVFAYVTDVNLFRTSLTQSHILSHHSLLHPIPIVLYSYMS
jgi:hypothetical protein